MTEHLSAEQAQAHLAHAAVLESSARREARWHARYLGAFAVGFAVVTLILGLVPGLVLRMLLFTGLWASFLTVMVTWALGKRAALRHVGSRAVPYWAGSGGVYAIVLIVGMPRRLGDAWYWVPAALLVAAPLAVGAWRESRR